ncbi:LuxR C-terminal-related transcriptional regulator [Streptomyces sp. LP05-1]|uniref:LuxR C-terminal-related transcriptional regulator n=1 Tax=Streptomyces pyxinae TaxID=2970734 RepID=A0ABT2CC31_9ACTN|nr:LuxR C-terminal-related transcriptional regulator [Streptomyces sp. LP05-1]MCS0634974.1 LuxR C-terminal-related transcriptional regulator [Streptomyces sp. LP05-1]
MGREAESARLAQVLDGLERGRGAVVEITGEPGAGKTQLACGLAEQAARRGLPVIWARAPRSGEGPFRVFRDTAGPAGAAEASDPAAWCELIRRRAAGGVLLVDELHRADPSSLELALRLIRSFSSSAPFSAPSSSSSPPPSSPPSSRSAFVLVLAHRPRQSPPALLEALDLGVRTDRIVRVEAGPLDVAAVAALLDRWRRPAGAVVYGAGAPDADMAPAHALPGGTGASAAALHTASKGLPGYLRLLVAAGFDAGLWPDLAGGDEDRLLREAAPLLAELGELSGPARAAARAAAVLGGMFRPADAARIAGLGAREGLEACAELVRADLVRPADHGQRLAFRHPVVGQVAHAECELPFLLDAHRRALRIAAERGAPALERARHAEHLVHTDGAAAARVLAEGAAQTVTRAPALAARWLRLALDALPARGRGTGERAAWELAHCRALIASGRVREARARAHDLLAGGGPSLTGRAGDGGARPAPGLLLRAYAVCADAERLLCRYEEAEAIARAGMALLPRPLPAVLSAEATELIYEYGLVHVLSGTHDRIRPLLREAARARTEAGPSASVALGVLIAFCDVFSGDIARGAPDVAHCAALVDALPDGVAGHTPDVLALLGCAELYLERFTDARRHLQRGLDAATGGAHKHIRAHQLLGLTMIDQWAGRLDEAERRAAEAEELARAVGAPDVVTLATAMRAMTLVWARGRRYAGEAVALAARAVDTTALGRGWWATSAISLLAHAQLLTGDATGCLRTLLDGGGGEGLPQVQPTFRPSLLALMATAALAGGDAEGAGRLLADAEADAGRLGLPLQWACVHRAGAQLRSTRGEHAGALELFERAAAGFRGGGLPVQHAWTLIAAAPVTAAVRGPAAALDVLGRAGALARLHGATLAVEEAERVRGRLCADSRPGRGASPTAGPRTADAPATDPSAVDLRSALSEREREVADLAATGLRSRQIAERLFLSHRTVDSHLGSAYRKLGVSSRTALARALGPAVPGQALPGGSWAEP